MDEIKNVVRRYRGNLSQDDFATLLTEAFHPYRLIRRQHISNWEKGVTPEIFSMIYLREHAKSRSSEWQQKS